MKTKFRLSILALAIMVSVGLIVGVFAISGKRIQQEEQSLGISTKDKLIVGSTLKVSGATTLSSTLAAGATTITGQLSASTKIGVATTTPMGQLGIGNGVATSTLSAGKFCMYAGQEDGTKVYVRLTSTGVNGSPFATSTVSCF